MEFPVLVKIESKKIAYIANSLDELPNNQNFKIVKSHPKEEDYQIDLPYKVINGGVCSCNPWFHDIDEEGNIHCRACGVVTPKEKPLQTEETDVKPENDETPKDNGSIGDTSS